MSDTATRLEGVALVQKLWQDYLDRRDTTIEETKQFITEVKEDLNLRDYVMGMPLELVEGGIEKEKAILMVAEWIAERVLSLDSEGELVEGVSTDDLIPFITITAIFHFELGNLEQAKKGLDMCGDYSLATLIRRVIMAGWGADEMWSMRQNLHQKVKEALTK